MNKFGEIQIVIVFFQADMEMASCWVEIFDFFGKRVHCLINGPDHSLDFSNKIWRKVTVVEFDENIGLPAAFNFVAKKLDGNDLLVTFDQDSNISIASLQSLIATLSKMPTEVAALAPFPSTKFLLEDGKIEENVGIREVDFAISSGFLCRVSALAEIGWFDEQYFIDKVDLDICMRLKLAGYLIYQDRNVLMGHTYGHPKKKFGVPYNSYGPCRHYFMARSRVIFYRKFKDVIALSRLKLLALTLLHATRVLVFEERPRIRLKSLCKGFFGGF